MKTGQSKGMTRSERLTRTENLRSDSTGAGSRQHNVPEQNCSRARSSPEQRSRTAPGGKLLQEHLCPQPLSEGRGTLQHGTTLSFRVGKEQPQLGAVPREETSLTARTGTLRTRLKQS